MYDFFSKCAPTHKIVKNKHNFLVMAKNLNHTFITIMRGLSSIEMEAVLG